LILPLLRRCVIKSCSLNPSPRRPSTLAF
jgi:hypothetical protein